MSLTLHTARITYSGSGRLDVTRKAGSIFAPSWPLVMAGKAKGWAFYVPRYEAEMRRSYQRHKAEWLALLERERLVLCCYCARPEHCHRTLLAQMLVKVGQAQGIKVNFAGELA
jgi:hypothetical protein